MGKKNNNNLWLLALHLKILSVTLAGLIWSNKSLLPETLISSSAKQIQKSQRWCPTLTFWVDGHHERPATGGPPGATATSRDGAASGGQDFLQQEPEARGICRRQEGGVCQVSAEQSHQVTYPRNRKPPSWAQKQALGPVLRSSPAQAGTEGGALGRGFQKTTPSPRNRRGWKGEV